jgi:predicted metal-binding protein
VAPTLKRIRSDWQGAILVCGKCTRKIDGGFGKKGQRPLAKALRKILGASKGRKGALGVVETQCLGICPKRAVIVVDSRRPGEWLSIPAGAELVEVAARIDRGEPGAA